MVGKTGRVPLLRIAICLTLLAGACDGTSPVPRVPGSPSASDPGTAFDPSGCPVDDEEFCAQASRAAHALLAGDADALFRLSFPQRFDCDEVDIVYFPACETSERLVGFPVGGGALRIEVLHEAAYRSQLEAILGAIDPSFTDEHGDGAPAILGVGTCGPDLPGRRSYHLVWTAAVSEGGGPSERLIGSFEFALDDSWSIGLWFLDTVDGWEELYEDPFTEVGCDGGRSPWLA